MANVIMLSTYPVTSHTDFVGKGSTFVAIPGKKLNGLSDFSINADKYKNTNNLWDWKLWIYIENINKNYVQLPCIQSGNFKSTII